MKIDIVITLRDPKGVTYVFSYTSNVRVTVPDFVAWAGDVYKRTHFNTRAAAYVYTFDPKLKLSDLCNDEASDFDTLLSSNVIARSDEQQIFKPESEADKIPVGAISARRDLTLRELQTQLPWTVHYHHDFRASPMAHKDFGHALLHIMKAAGKLAAIVNDAEHGGSEFKPEDVDFYVADMVVCALRMANTCPGRTIDLQRVVEERIETKNNAELRRIPQ